MSASAPLDAVVSAQAYATVDLVDLGSIDPRFSNVLAPSEREEAVGLTAQFTDNAEVYASAYAATEYYTWLIKRAASLAGFYSKPTDILDIGAGAGDNSTFPAATMWPDAQIVATDLSPQLLAILNREAHKRDLSDRLTVVCVDAMKDIFKENSFDIVIGSAILHHLIEPVDALRSAHRVLRPGGVAIFFEPFELGYSLIACIFDRLVTESSLREEKLSDEVNTFLMSFINDVRRRLGRDKSDPIYREIDDKWLFSRSYLIEAARKAGFKDTVIEGIHAPQDQLSNLIKTFLRIGAQTTVEELPEWAQNHCKNADEFFVDSSKDILSEAIVIMRKL